MTVRRLLVGLLILAVLAVLMSGVWDSGNRRSDTFVSPSADATAPAETPAQAPAEPQPEFPDADLQAGLEAICSQRVQDSAEEAPAQPYEQMIRTVSERLAVSSSAENLLAAALLAENDSAAQIDLIERAVSAGPTDPLVLWSAVRICSNSRDSPDCPLREWEQQQIAVDGQNSESWMLVASNRYAAGEVGAALDAMRFASTAAESRIYWPETMELIERALRVGDSPFPLRASEAFGVAASELPRYQGLTKMCEEQASGNAEWADVCLRYGELLEIQGKGSLTVSIARTVQRRVLEALGESEKAAEVEERRLAGSRELSDASNRLQETGQRLIMQSPTLFYGYLAAYRSEGEAAALQRIAAQIERLVAQQPELACE
jgi:hypothetical protein